MTTEKRELYGFSRMPARISDVDVAKVERLPYGRFRNVYVYITEACQLRCDHCYMGGRLDRALKMSSGEIRNVFLTWRMLGGSKLTILGGEPTLHPDFIEAVKCAGEIGYEHIITTTNGLNPAMRKLRRLASTDFAYVQVSLDGGSSSTHDAIRGAGTFDETVGNIGELCRLGYDTRIICTVNRANAAGALDLLALADELGVSLVKYHVFSTIGIGAHNDQLALLPREWIDFCDELECVAPQYATRAWYQPTYTTRDKLGRYASEGFRGCIGRTLDRISIFPDGRCYVCSYLFDTSLHFAEMVNGRVRLNHGRNEFDLFAGALAQPACGACKAASICQGGCPAEELAMAASSCGTDPDIIPVCRLWKSDAKYASTQEA
jgi:radical SAM protein with 4Fe4S-binding SPASM domain